MDTPDTDFDYDDFPRTGAITMIPSGTPTSYEWEPPAPVDLSGIATDPLKSTFNDLDLAPAREELLRTHEWDADYWAD